MFQFTMVGATFRPAEAKEVVKRLTVGAVVELEADPDNEYDPTAVKVMAEGHHIGFVPAVSNGDLFARLIDGEEILAQVIGFENSLKPVLEVMNDEVFPTDEDYFDHGQWND